MSGISIDQFPRFLDPVQARWAPLYVRPIEGSIERLVFGVVAVSEEQYHIEIANCLDRLECLYGDQSGVVLSSIEFAKASIEEDLKERRVMALADPIQYLSNIGVGDLRSGEGENLRNIAVSWLSMCSSLHSIGLEKSGLELAETSNQGKSRASIDRLPVLIKNYVAEKRSGLVDFFSEDVRLERRRRGPSQGAKTNIDFAGSKLVANFSTLKVTGIPSASREIKTRLWELEMNRDQDGELGQDRAHEMIVQSPSSDDPQYTEKQLDKAFSALEELEEQANRKEIKLYNMSNVEEIGTHLLSLEAA